MAGGRRGAIARVTVAYLVGAAAAVAAGWLLRGRSPILVAGAGDAAATAAVFVFSLAWNNSSVYDPYWSVAPPLVAAYWIAVAAPSVPVARQVAATALVTVWAARLTWNWLRRWQGLGHEDWRYVDLRRSTGRGYWPVSLVGLHFMPTVLVFAGCLPLWWALAAGARPLGPLDGAAALTTAAAIALEAVADRQLHRFAVSAHPPDALLDSGLWAWSRHPNYAGEVLLWWGLLLFGLAAGAPWWSAAGAVAITLLFLFVSVPMIEKRMASRRPHYLAARRGVPSLALWPPRRRARK